MCRERRPALVDSARMGGALLLQPRVLTAMHKQVEGLTSWALLARRGPFLRFLPALASTLLLWAVLQHARSPLALPATLLAIPAAFYAVLLAAGVSLADAQAAGWVPQPAQVLHTTNETLRSLRGILLCPIMEVSVACPLCTGSACMGVPSAKMRVAASNATPFHGWLGTMHGESGVCIL